MSVGIDTSIPPEERYQIVGRIAAGGMAEIYLSRMVSSAGVEREVVLKRLMPELQTDKEFVQMFHDEANIASRLSHPNVVRIYELGELDGSLFIAMEFLRGVNLRDLLARLHAQKQDLPVPFAVRIATGALDALDYAHQFTDAAGRPLNVVHRDVSPQNIIVTFEGGVKLVDFGVAKAEGRLHQTRAGLIKGKFAYMSPEQVGGGTVDGRSDLFALAEVFYELLLKRHPFYASSDMEVLRAILDKDPPHPCSIDSRFPPTIGEILMRGMKKAPGDRFESAGKMQDALERYLQEQRAAVTTAMLGRYISDLFADRIEAEQIARDNNDDDELIEAVTAGRSEPIPGGQSAQRRRSSVRAAVVEESDQYEMPASRNTGRDRVIEISRSPEPVEDPAERGAPSFLAHSGYTDGPPRRFHSEIRGLFDDVPDQADDEPDTDLGLNIGAARNLVSDSDEIDEGELPTVFGHLSAEEMEEIRGTKERAQKKAEAKKSNGRTERAESVKVTPVVSESPGKVNVSAASPRAHKVKVSHSPGTIDRVRTSKTPPSKTPASVTPRSRTVVAKEDTTPKKKKKRNDRADRLGLLFFVSGLGALIGALVYAVWLYTSSRVELTEFVLETTPSGATIIFDGSDTGGKTPQVFQNISAEFQHVVEFHLPGFKPCKKELPPTTQKHTRVACELEKL